MKNTDTLTKFKIDVCPFKTFRDWYKKAENVEENVNAMALATSSLDGSPSVRFVLHKGLKDEQFLFFSHYDGGKGNDLRVNPIAEIAFYWHQTGRQVRVKGSVTKCSADFSKKYFASRALGSQVATKISEQSVPIASREELIKKYDQRIVELNGQEELCPNNWGGFLIRPSTFEFFIYGEYRLNDRFLFQRSDDQWDISRLQP